MVTSLSQPQKDKTNRDRPRVSLKHLEQSLLREHPNSSRVGEPGHVSAPFSLKDPVWKQEIQSANGLLGLMFENYRPLVLGPYHIVPELKVDFMKVYVPYSKDVHSTIPGRERRKGHGP